METTSWQTYPKIYNLGHGVLKELLSDPVVVEEKIDGSQFSFGVFDGELKCRSRRVNLNVNSPDSLFVEAVQTAQHLAPKLHDGWTYRCEYLKKPKHNCLTYDRTPERHLIVFDINTGNETYLAPEQKRDECRRIKLECVPLYFEGVLDSLDELERALGQKSVLGNSIAEGLVVKNYHRYDPSGKVLLAKLVTDSFRERHNKEWKKANPGSKDIVEQLISALKTEARWGKAVQHLSEDGSLSSEMRDIPALMKEVGTDLLSEEAEAIKEQLWKWAWPKIQRGVTRGFPEWYKGQIA